MDEKSKIYLEKLFNDRMDSANTLEKPSMRGVQRTVVEKYSDQAHFVYELLQNADDVEATKATFDLYKDKLVFKHNGKRHFSVSDPLTEDEDSKSGKLGDINSITSIANSNKTEARIGKFGIGFKAVFQYTSSPIIYDPDFRFRIDRFIVPVLIDNDYVGRQNDETIFVFPFNHKEKSSTDAYNDISEKLCSLTYPLLFLKKLKEVELFVNNKPIGRYSKKIEQNITSGNISIEYICLSNNYNGRTEDKRLWLFTTKFFSHNISVGFFVNSKGQLIPVHDCAFCFFPTKETTNLNFIIQAPFLLTDSREGIKSKEQHNQTMIIELSKLAAKSILLLKQIGNKLNTRLLTDDIIYIIPTDENMFDNINNKNKISFKPFYIAIKNAFLTEEIIPAIDGYVSKRNAFFTNSKSLTQLFANEQLAVLTHNPRAKWTFTSIKQPTYTIQAYIQSITNMTFNDDTFLNSEQFLISIEFTQRQTFEWLHKFYMWLNETERRISMAKSLPIFIDQNNRAVAAFDKSNHLQLFLPFEGNTIYSTVNEKLLENDETKKFILKLGIMKPSMKDEINSIIIPKYKKGGFIDSIPDFKNFFNHFKECSRNEIDSFISLIKDIPFIMSFSKADTKSVRLSAASSLYFPLENLFEYFETKPQTLFINLDKYKEIVAKEDEQNLLKFFKKLGVSKKVRILEFEMNLTEATKYIKTIPKHTKYIKFVEKRPDGFDEIMRNIQSNRNKSVTLWNYLLTMSKKETLKTVDVGICKYFYYRDKVERFISTFKTRLKTEKWLINSKEELVSADQIYLDELTDHYEVDSNEFPALVKFLEIKERKLDSVLSQQQMNDLDLVQTLKKKGLIEKVHDLVVDKEVEELQTRSVDFDFDVDQANESKEEINDEGDEDDSSSLLKSIARRRNKFALEILKNKAEIRKLVQLEKLREIAEKSQRYSFIWFKTLLQIESIENGHSNNDSKKGISIVFEKVELVRGKKQTLILKHPNRSIPVYLEDLSGIPLTLNMNDQFKTLTVEIVSVQSYSIEVKLNSPSDIKGIDLNRVKYAKIEASNPIFLLDELLKSFNELNFENDFNLFENLCENIEFIFGPPGTGKTTYLSQKVIIPLMHEKEDFKVLVLTPTNKAADVVIRRIFDSETSSCTEWLVRFGTSSDESSEVLSVYRKKSFDIRKMPRSVVVTTIARFPYDFFSPEGSENLQLKEIEWDFIVLDEASMIPIFNVIYPLFKSSPKKFFIAGDPFQIQPITTADAWKNENIYTMVGLSSFTDPQTRPHNYRVELLTKQYRSVPSVGGVYSKFAYGGILSHDRTEESKKVLFADDAFKFRSLNMIKFPVNSTESIYKPRRLQNRSSYHVYSALFVSQLVKFISEKLTSKFTIGVISPYKGQIEIIDKLLSLAVLPENVVIQSGTIHGFQGDECDVVFVVLNPPPNISESPEMFLNSKNIINVSISRTRDYLFVLMPDDGKCIQIEVGQKGRSVMQAEQ